MSEVAYGIKETKEALAAVISIANAGKTAVSDGKIDFNDIALLLSVFPKIQPAIDGSAEIPKEIGDLSAEEAADLIAYVSSELKVGDEKVNAVIVQALSTVASIAKLVQTIRA